VRVSGLGFICVRVLVVYQVLCLVSSSIWVLTYGVLSLQLNNEKKKLNKNAFETILKKVANQN